MELCKFDNKTGVWKRIRIERNAEGRIIFDVEEEMAGKEGATRITIELSDVELAIFLSKCLDVLFGKHNVYMASDGRVE